MDSPLAQMILESNCQEHDVLPILNMTEEDIYNLHYFKKEKIKREVKGVEDTVIETRVNALSYHKGMIRLLQDYSDYKHQTGDPPNEDWSNIDPEEFRNFRFHSPAKFSTPVNSY